MAKFKTVFDYANEEIPVGQVLSDGAESNQYLYDDPNPDGLIPDDFELPPTNVLAPEDEIADVSRAAIAVSDIADNLEGSNDMPADQYNVLAKATESLIKRINKDNYLMPRMESYHGRADRKNALKIMVEDLKDHVMAAIRKIVGWVKSLGKWVYSLFQKSRTSYKGISDRAKRLIDESKEATTKTKKDGSLEIDSEILSSYFSKDGKAYTAPEIISEYKKYTNEIGGDFSENMFKESADALLPIIPEMANNPDKKEVLQKIDDVIRKIRDHILKNFSEGFEEHRSDEKNHILSYRLPFGSEAIVCAIEIEEGLQKSIKITGQNVKVANGLKKIKILEPSECLMLATNADEHASYGLNNRHKKIESEVFKIQTAIDKACGIAEKAARTQSDDVKTDMFSLEFLRGTFASLMTYVRLYFSVDSKINQMLLNYVETSLKYYE